MYGHDLHPRLTHDARPSMRYFTCAHTPVISVSMGATNGNQHRPDTQLKKNIYKNIFRSIKFDFTHRRLYFFIVAQHALTVCPSALSSSSAHQ